MRRITLCVAAVAAYTLLGMALASADKDAATKLVDKDAEWAGEAAPYKCPGDVWDDVSYGVSHLFSDTDRYVIVIDSVRPRRGAGRENDRRKGVRLPVIRVDIETGTVTFNGRRCRLYIRPGMEGE